MFPTAPSYDDTSSILFKQTPPTSPSKHFLDTNMTADEKVDIVDPKSYVDQHVEVGELRQKILILETALEESDAQIRPAHIFGFPAHLELKHLTPNQRRLQKFPHSMSAEDSRRTWLITAIIIIAIDLYQFPLFYRLVWDDQTGRGYYLIAWQAVLHYFIFGMNLYPFIYACVLKTRQGHWPTLCQVWMSQKAQEEQRAIGNAGSPVTNFRSLLATLPMYSYMGLLVCTHWKSLW
ncbi:hypothetical protein BGZ60DRAFT_35172 [Tricladium varicosporioides]|nr:hypothetical protein BGZ60DRAFT_35172 [Hymenoscyphus varicosporioides]